MHDAVLDPLLRDLDRGDISGVAQKGRGAVADFAHGRDRYVTPDIGGISFASLGRGEALEAFELDSAKDEMDRFELRPIKRARRSFNATFDLEPEAVGTWGLGNEWASDLFAGWRHSSGLRIRI